jgi:hypothetical protein
METKFKQKDCNKRNKKKQWLEGLRTNKSQNKIENIRKPQESSPENEEKKGKKHRRFVKRNTWKRTQDKKKMETITAVYNYSDLTLTEGMTKILNRGLNFCITPILLNITEILVAYRKFERKMKWKDFFADQNPDETKEWKQGIFPKEKTNLPARNSKNLVNF